MANQSKLIKSLGVEFYRGFTDRQIIEFAMPNGKHGSGLTVIVGPNNTGKTSIIEALMLKGDAIIKDDEIHPENSPKIVIIDNDGKTTTFTKSSKVPKIKVTGEKKPSFELIPSRRHFSDQMSSRVFGVDDSYKSTGAPRGGSGGNVGEILYSIHDKDDQREKFQNLLKQLIPNFSDWGIGADDQGTYLKYVIGAVQHKVRYLGEGVQSLFKICAHLISDKHLDKMLIIDEPELSLHPQAQKQLAKIVSEHAANRQILICTHSPYFINWTDLQNGAEFIRLNKQNTKCAVHKLGLKLDRKGGYFNLFNQSLDEWQRPQFLDTVAKELFFTNKVLFLEGQEDVGLIKKWLRDENIDVDFDVFGYGVGGFRNLPHFLEMAKDLGLEKVAAIFDKGTKEDKIFSKTKKDFPEYCIKQLPTEDIRDKEATKNKNAKTGVFDKSGKIKEEYKEAFETLMKEISNYMTAK